MCVEKRNIVMATPSCTVTKLLGGGGGGEHSYGYNIL